MGMNRELLQNHFNLQRPSEMLKAIYSTASQKNNENLIRAIKSEQRDFKNKIGKNI